MTDKVADELIDDLEEANRRMYELVTAQEASEIREDVSNARSALRSAIAQVEQERDGLRKVIEGKAKLFVKDALISKDGVDFFSNHPLFGLFVYSFAEVFAELKAKNYLEMQISRVDIGDLVITFQKKDGKTPHEIRKELEAELDGFKSMLKSETLEKLEPGQLIAIIHDWQNKDHSYQCDIAKLEAQLKDANEDAERLADAYTAYIYKAEETQTMQLHHARLAKKEQG